MRANLGSVLVRQNKFQSSLMHCFVIHLKIMRQRWLFGTGRIGANVYL